MSLNVLKLICVTAAQGGKLMWQPHGLIPFHWNQLQNVDNTGTETGSHEVEILNIKTLLCISLQEQKFSNLYVHDQIQI
jgi:hypothetical protein